MDADTEELRALVEDEIEPGTVVWYHGSQPDWHGFYRVEGKDPAHRDLRYILEGAASHTLGECLRCVRPGSFTIAPSQRGPIG